MSKKLKLIQKKKQVVTTLSPITDSLLGSIKCDDDFVMKDNYDFIDALRGRFYKAKKVTKTWHNNTK